MPRGNRVPFDNRERIVRAFEDEGEDYLMVANTLGVNQSTARGMVARYIREERIHERPWRGRNNKWVDDEMQDCIVLYCILFYCVALFCVLLNKNCILTPFQIN